MKSFLKQIEESFQSLDEKKAKPDFLDLDNDGDTEESMKKAAKEKNEAAKPDYLDFDEDGDTEELQTWSTAWFTILGLASSHCKVRCPDIQT